MAGAVEEGGHIAESIVDALKREPISLALVLMNIALPCMFYYIAQKSSETRAREVAMIYDNEKHTAEMLARCVDPGTLREILQQFREHSGIPLPRPRPPAADEDHTDDPAKPQTDPDHAG